MKLRRPPRLYTLALPLLLFAGELPAPPPEKECKTKAKINNTGELQFGWVAVTGGGSATVSPDGLLTTAGGVVAIPGGMVSPARFDVTGCPDAVFSIILPSSVSLRHRNNTMTLDRFTSSPEGSSVLNGIGVASLEVGATLNAQAQQPAGRYSGSFTIELVF